MKAFIAVAFCLVAAVVAAHDDGSVTKQGTVADRTRLLANLFNTYNKKVNPDAIKLEFGVNLIDFGVCPERNVLETYIWIRYAWKDERLAWNPEEYGGAELIRLDANEVWKPDVTLYNSADPVNMVNCWDSNVILYNSGKVLWVPPCKMTSQCSLTLKREPYGEQKCSLKFGSWTFDGNIMDIDFFNKTSSIDVTHLQKSSGYEITGNVGQKNTRYYSCCKEPYQDLTYNITFKRIPGEELFARL